ncbi:hypothetical protein [Bacillus swezeyi]|uniref:Uncharacterized protein n=1 Tax=Bacillus swezeyi TaxID=1925020 RepID=A0A5M8RIQ8_9BACI|nr:hypothetical protein [Bacillus swezeyi]KAA6446943.1 hypothetical protein DX927_23110 [Bacillus swezeyi]KAA6471511.1 hypothetical protein DX928_23350 [Bacillus swezeyi]
MALPLLNEKKIDQFLNNVKDRGVWLSDINFRYNPRKHFLMVDGLGASGMQLDEEYYENVRDHLEYADLSWLTPMCNKLSTHLSATINVLDDGTINQDTVRLQFTVEVNEHDNLKRLVYTKLKNFIYFKDFIEEINFKGTGSKIRAIILILNVDVKKLSKILSSNNDQVNNTVNKSILEQWVATASMVEQHYTTAYHINCIIPVLKGKMQYNIKKDSVMLRINLDEGAFK